MNPISVIGDAWRLYSGHWRHFASVGLTIFFVVAVSSLVLGLLGDLGVLLAQIVLLAGTVLLTGSLVAAVADVRDGRVDLSVGETIGSAREVFWPLLGASILAGIAVFAGLVIFIVPGLLIATFWFVVAPSIVIERLGVFAAFGHSFGLVRRSGWATFAVLLLTWGVMVIMGFVLVSILTPLPTSLAVFLTVLVQGAVFAPFAAIAVTLTYYRLGELPDRRMRSRVTPGT